MLQECETESIATAGPEPWSVLRVETSKELAARDLLERQDVETYVPTGLMKLDRHGSTKIINGPLFPAYVFARYEVGRTVELIASIPYLYDALRFGGRYAFVDDEEIVRVRALATACQQPIELFPALAVGTQVEVIAGSLIGCRGIFLESKGRGRIYCNIDILGKSVRSEVPRQWVMPIKAKDSASVGDKRQLDVMTLRRKPAI